MELVNNNLEILTRNIINHLEGEIGLIQSIIAINGKRNVLQVNISSDFPDAWVINEDDFIVKANEGINIKTRLNLPAIVISMYDGYSGRAGTGDLIGFDNKNRAVRAIKNNYVLQFDVWARTPEQRDVIGSRVINILFKQRHKMLRSLGIEELRMSAFGERGFDLTDRILQYQSHQITKVWRRLLEFNVISENYYVDTTESEYMIIEKLELITPYSTYEKGMIIGDLVEEYLKGIWENINIGLIE